jgi:hypothetical protein
MGMAEICQVELVGKLGNKTSGNANIQHWEQKERMRRAMRALGITWGAMIVSVFIPLAHFILVPALLIAGPIVANWVYKQQDMIMGGEAICPQCGKPFHIIRTTLKWPLNDTCSECHENVTISPALS